MIPRTWGFNLADNLELVFVGFRILDSDLPAAASFCTRMLLHDIQRMHDLESTDLMENIQSRSIQYIESAQIVCVPAFISPLCYYPPSSF